MSDEITAVVGHQLYSFDGRILEIFGAHPTRFHVRHMQLVVTGPDRKGRRTMVINAVGLQHTSTFTAEEWATPALPGLLEAVQSAIGG
jgi:hypothetical protein